MTPLPVSDIVVVGVGARTHAGLTALQATMSARASKIDCRDTHMIDKFGDRIGMCRLASIGDHVMGLERFAALGGPALTQASFAWHAASRRAGKPLHPLPLVLALPSRARPGVDRRLEAELLAHVEAKAQVPIDHARSSLVFGDRGGGAQAFGIAVEALRADRHHAIAVGGVDSFFDPDALEWLDRELRLHSPKTENGFIPGEGAGFLVLARRDRAGAVERLAQVLSVGVADEPRPYGSDEPCIGVGITRAVRDAVALLGARARRIGWVATDVVNERHRVDEWQYAMARAHEAFSEGVIHDQPLLKTGDLGAASAAVLAAMAVIRWQTRCAPADCALLGLHSDGAERGAVLLGAEGVS